MESTTKNPITTAAGRLAAALQGVDAALLGLEVCDSLPELLSLLAGNPGHPASQGVPEEAAFLVAALAEAPGPVPPAVLHAAEAMRSRLEVLAPDLLDAYRREDGRLSVMG